VGPLEVKDPAVELEGLGTPRGPEDPDGLPEPPARLGLRDAEALELLGPPSCADPEDETPGGNAAHRCGVLGEAEGVVQRRQHHAGADLDGAGGGGDRRRRHCQRRHPAVVHEVVLRGPHRVETVLLAEAGELQGLPVPVDPRAGIAVGAFASDESVTQPHGQPSVFWDVSWDTMSARAVANTWSSAASERSLVDVLRWLGW